ncbi:MAG: choice-of-anchor D domain-containing protein [Akkermansiaceae bacterium]
MKLLSFLLIGLIPTLPALGQVTLTLYEEDFEAGGANLTAGNNGAARTIVADPAAGGAQGMVAAVDLAGGNQWGEINAAPATVLDLPAATEPGTSEVTMKMKIYIPSVTTFATTEAGPDRVGLIIRWNNLQATNVSQFIDWDSVAQDSWEEIVLTDFVPSVDSDGNGITRLRPILSFHDRDDNAVSGPAIYIDDFSIEVGVSEDDPNFSHLNDLNFGQIDQNGGPITRVIPLANAGENETLTFTEITLGGTNADLFTLSEVTLPLDVAPGESVDLTVTIDPDANLGFFNAKVDFVTNDLSTPNLTTNIQAESIEPFIGKELIINGDFENGFAGWRQNDRFNPTTEQFRSGGNSAVFNLAGGAEWGEARVEQLDNEIPDHIPITEEMIGKDFEYTAWYYWPSENGMAPNDSIMTIFRWNAINTGNTTLGRFNQIGGLPRDTWFRVRGTGQIPAQGGDGSPTTGVTVIWSFRDVDSDAAGGELMYIDDISFKVDVPFDLPPFDLKITNLVHDTESDVVTFDYTARPGTTYAIDRSTGLNEIGQPDGWIELSDSELADADTESFTDTGAPSTGAKFFYRVRVAE